MREKHKENESFNDGKNEELYEISDTGYGLESVTKGNDFAEGDSIQTGNFERLK